MCRENSNNFPSPITRNTKHVTRMNIPNKQQNIAEYLLYMWQIEDLLRAYGLDIDKVQQHLIDTMPHDDNAKKELRDWYEGLILMMKSEGVQEKGHLQINKNVVIELTDLHLSLLKDPSESPYIATYYKTLPYIVELRAKSGQKDVSEIETCFTALYGYLLLKLQKKEISYETQSAVNQLSKLMALLSEKYRTK